jgi:hypothetical protein
MATKKKAKKAVDRKKTAKKPEPPVVQTAYRVGDFVRLPRFEDNPEAYGQIQHVEQALLRYANGRPPAIGRVAERNR